jgi:hypothetical protein
METTGTSEDPPETPITPPPDEAGYESVSGKDTTPPSGAPETAEQEDEQ